MPTHVGHGATTTHGGQVQASCGPEMNYYGIRPLRMGDGFFCPLCKRPSYFIGSGIDHDVILFGKPALLDGAVSTCGARLLPNNVRMVRVLGGGTGATRKGGISQNAPTYQKNELSNTLAPNEEKKKCPDECVVETVRFETTPGPYIISMEMWEKILEFEKYAAKPYQPGDDTSGVTLAIGYDLGQQSSTQIKKDLAPFYTPEQIERLLLAQGKKGGAAKALIPKLSDITITKDKALQLATVLKTRYANDVLSIYPEALKLHPHCQGVLLSLVFNRGSGLKDPANGLTREHMRKIQSALKAGTPEKIPNIFRDMSTLWNKTGPKGNSGVGKRRKAEADIFEKGLKCDCYQ